jgi:hypothetical protein
VPGVTGVDVLDPGGSEGVNGAGAGSGVGDEHLRVPLVDRAVGGSRVPVVDRDLGRGCRKQGEVRAGDAGRGSGAGRARPVPGERGPADVGQVGAGDGVGELREGVPVSGGQLRVGPRGEVVVGLPGRWGVGPEDGLPGWCGVIPRRGRGGRRRTRAAQLQSSGEKSDGGHHRRDSGQQSADLPCAPPMLDRRAARTPPHGPDGVRRQLPVHRCRPSPGPPVRSGAPGLSPRPAAAPVSGDSCRSPQHPFVAVHFRGTSFVDRSAGPHLSWAGRRGHIFRGSVFRGSFFRGSVFRW